MNALRLFAVAALSLALAAPAFGKSASRTRLVTWSNPAKVGAVVRMQAEVDGFAGRAPTGTASFANGAVVLGSGTLSPKGAGQATLSVNGFFSCAMTSVGGVKCWGSNESGFLGDGTTTTRLTPVDVTGLSSGVVAIEAGHWHSCALTTVGGVKCWGYNGYGELGDGTTTHRHTPVAVSGLSTGVVALTAGFAHSCALTAVGGVKCWGLNEHGQLGDGTVTDRSTPVPVQALSSGVIAITAGFAHTCALTSAGAVKCWGYNRQGQLGNGTRSESHTAVAVSGLSSGVAAIAAGGFHSCALTSAGAAKCWGRNADGAVGDGTTNLALVPVSVLGLSSGVVAIAAGADSSCGVTSAGGAMCWGANLYGQLGDGTTKKRLAPVSVSGLSTGVAAITAGVHSCASLSGGAVKCWGENRAGAVGDGTTSLLRSTPVQVVGLTPLLRARTRFGTRVLPVGAHTLRATYSGNSTYSPSSGSRAQTIIP
jgi:hypothetical protein